MAKKVAKKAVKKATKKVAKKATKKAVKKVAKKAVKKVAKKAVKKVAKKAVKKVAKKAVVKKPAAAKANQSGVIDEATLNWTDLTGSRTGATALGSNKFYKATIVETGGQYQVIFNYGRVGQTGQTQTVMAATLDGAKRAFDSKLNAKMRKGYRKVEMRTQQDEIAKAKSKGVQVATKKKAAKRTRNFHKEVENLLTLIYTAAGEAAKKGLSSAAGVSDAAPLGNLHDSQLDKGADLLEKIDTAVNKTKAPRKKLIDLTNDYLSNIPRNIDHARRGGRLDIDQVLLNTKERIKKEREFLSLLRDLHLQKDVFAAAAESEDKVEVWYDGLLCDISWVDAKSAEFKRVAKLFDVGQSPMNSNFYNKLKVKRIWTLERQGKKQHFDKYAQKVTTKKDATGIVHGWHGTRTRNLMGISRSGLLMPENLPKGVQVTGFAFGKGIYHAPRWPDAGQDRVAKDGKKYKRYNGALKSMNYTSMAGAYWNASSSGSLGYMYLEEIALGIPEVHLTACWGRKRPDKKYDYIYAQAFGNPQLSHDEIVTFDENASRLTHLLEIGRK